MQRSSKGTRFGASQALRQRVDYCADDRPSCRWRFGVEMVYPEYALRLQSLPETNVNVHGNDRGMELPQ
jgi:hypothetical protein